MKNYNTKFKPTLEESEIQYRINWFIVLRWLAILGVIGAVIFSTQILGIKLPITQLSLTILLLILCNTIFLLYSKFFSQKRIGSIGIKTSIRFADIQIIADLFILALLIHFSGGVENPFSFYFIFHMVIASILLSLKSAYYQATLAAFLFSSIIFLEYFQIIPHYRLERFMLAPLYDNIYYCLGNFFVFTTTMYFTIYMATSITIRLRKRQREIVALKDELEQRNIELQETQANLIQAEKMTSLGQIAAGVAHEINNPLTGVLVYTKLLLKNIGDKKINETIFEERLRTMEKEIGRSSRIIKNLLDFSRQATSQPRVCDLMKKIDDALNILKNQAKLNNINIIKEFDSIPQVFADPDQIQQVFVNVILNAIQSMPNSGTLTVKTKYKDDEDKVEIAFIDTGYGIKKEDLSKLFTPFFTTKGKDKGVGLGLAVCYNIINRHNGEISAESEEGKGATFTIRLNAYYGEQK